MSATRRSPQRCNIFDRKLKLGWR